MKPRDLGLTYLEASHGIQTAVLHDMNVYEMDRGWHRLPGSGRTRDDHKNGPKHLRVAVDLSHVSAAALAHVLIAKGIMTLEEYLEAQRLFANEELANWQEKYPKITFR